MIVSRAISHVWCKNEIGKYREYILFLHLPIILNTCFFGYIRFSVGSSLLSRQRINHLQSIPPINSFLPKNVGTSSSCARVANCNIHDQFAD